LHAHPWCDGFPGDEIGDLCSGQRNHLTRGPPNPIDHEGICAWGLRPSQALPLARIPGVADEHERNWLTRSHGGGPEIRPDALVEKEWLQVRLARLAAAHRVGSDRVADASAICCVREGIELAPVLEWSDVPVGVGTRRRGGGVIAGDGHGLSIELSRLEEIGGLGNRQDRKAVHVGRERSDGWRGGLPPDRPQLLRDQHGCPDQDNRGQGRNRDPASREPPDASFDPSAVELREFW
jgi:hypothetical protein